MTLDSDHVLGDPRRALARRVYYGWIIVIGCFLASMIVFGTTYAFGVFYDSFITAFESSETLLAVVFGIQTALLYFAGVVVSRLVERYGSRRILALSSVLLVVGLLWTATAESYVELLASFGVVAALGMAGLYNVSYATLPQWFDRRRGTATGVASAGLGIGLVVIPPGTDALISAFGWRTAVVVLAGFIALVSIVTVVLFATDPDDVGADLSREFGDRSDVETDAAPDRNVFAIVTSSRFLLVFVGWTLIFAPMYVIFGHIVVHASETGIGRSVGVLSIAVIGIATSVARFGVGPFSDRFGRPRTFIASSLLLGGSTAALAVASSAAPFLIAVALFGLGYAGSGGLIGAVTADLFGNRSINTLFAVLSSSFAVAGLISPPAARLSFEAQGSYRPALFVFGLLGVLGGLCVWIALRSSGRSN
ncbi:MAG: MFS transporter [Natronomonas sp.]|jgi:MFS family permease|uniref:MFS transporter n=1 Tax=Natronomonas sp. TaxID=2184060 RepID=UPI0028703FAB|nr:MFS transporter [Natronomonas sp.]MDR9381351.1 MFS transporter [Natronomonas sp.]MDR9429310.1 MFS transporter [Natronomonas sp.]